MRITCGVSLLGAVLSGATIASGYCVLVEQALPIIAAIRDGRIANECYPIIFSIIEDIISYPRSLLLHMASGSVSGAIFWLVVRPKRVAAN